MLLLIDAGNTRIKWAVQRPGQRLGRDSWLASGAVHHGQVMQLAAHWQALPQAITHALISNVAGSAMADQLSDLLAAAGVPTSALTWFGALPECAGVRNGYRHPRQLGSDRFASLVGAHYLFPKEALLIATCGTATTIDALDEHGQFVGGMILPGLGLMAQSLALNTAQLPAVSSESVKHLFADNTQDAIISGCLIAQVGAITQARQRHASSAARCIISGGAAAYIAPNLPKPCEQIDNLVLIGLAASMQAP